MQLCRIIYYSISPWLLYLFRAILSLIAHSYSVPNQPRQQPTAVHVNETRSCNYS